MQIYFSFLRNSHFKNIKIIGHHLPDLLWDCMSLSLVLSGRNQHQQVHVKGLLDPLTLPLSQRTPRLKVANFPNLFQETVEKDKTMHLKIKVDA